MPCFDWCCPVSGVISAAFCRSDAGFNAGAIPKASRPLLAGGQLLGGLILSTVYSEKYKGRDMKPGEYADVVLPGANQTVQTRRTCLLHRCGSREVTAFIWLGHVDSDDPDLHDDTIYVAFGPLRKPKQLLKIFKACSLEHLDLGGGHTIEAIKYVKKKLDNLWGKYGFGTKLDEVVKSYPNHRFIFTGVSHGAAMAQAAGLKFKLLYPSPRLIVASYNAYKWTDAAGSALMRKTLRDGLLPVVLSRADAKGNRRWDSVAGVPYGLAPMPKIVLIDADTGELFPCTDPGNAHIGPVSFARAMELHFAKPVVTALRQATHAALLAAEDAVRPTLQWDGETSFRVSADFARRRTDTFEQLSSSFDAQEGLLPEKISDHSDQHSEHGSDDDVCY